MAVTNSALPAIARNHRLQFFAATKSICRRTQTIFATQRRSNEGVKSMKTTIAIFFAALLLLATVVTGQKPIHPPQAPRPPDPDPLAHLMFPPDMIMAHARELNLTDEQKTFMRSEVAKATATFQDLQWKLQDQRSEERRVGKECR